MIPKYSQQPAVLITGGAKRIGETIALHLSSLGYAIALHHNHSHTDVQRLARKIKEQGGWCEIFKADLAKENETVPLIKNVLKKLPNLKVLINNASIFERSNLHTEDLKIFDRHMAINLKAPYILSIQFAKHCKSGQIINLLETNIVKNKLTHVAYLLSKKALASLTNLSAVEFAPNIRVNGVAPGFILPPVKRSNAYIKKLLDEIPLKHQGNPLDIAKAIQFLLEHEYLTGQIIFVDGGQHLT